MRERDSEKEGERDSEKEAEREKLQTQSLYLHSSVFVIRFFWFKWKKNWFDSNKFSSSNENIVINRCFKNDFNYQNSKHVKNK